MNNSMGDLQRIRFSVISKQNGRLRSIEDFEVPQGRSNFRTIKIFDNSMDRMRMKNNCKFSLQNVSVVSNFDKIQNFLEI